MSKLALWPYPHIKRKPKVVEPATKEDIAELRADLIGAIKIMTPKQRLRLLKAMFRRRK